MKTKLYSTYSSIRFYSFTVILLSLTTYCYLFNVENLKLVEKIILALFYSILFIYIGTLIKEAIVKTKNKLFKSNNKV